LSPQKVASILHREWTRGGALLFGASNLFVVHKPINIQHKAGIFTFSWDFEIFLPPLFKPE
jgi:hypothetical protein